MTMQVSFLVRGEDVRKGFEDVARPEGVSQRVGTYHAEGGDLYYITLQAEGKSLASARVLARARDAVHFEADTRILRDDASAKFGELLYPGICEFERGLRAAFTIAMCSDFEQFDNEWVTSLKSKDLGRFRDYLLHDETFLKEARSLVQSKTKDELLSLIKHIEEHSVWSELFGENVMRSVKDCFKAIAELRNDVMHFHTITEESFDFGRRVLKRANREIRAYLADSQHDVDYPKRKAPDVREALAKMNENRASMLAELANQLSEVQGMYLAPQMREIREQISRMYDTPQMREIREQISRMYDTPGMREALERIASISKESLADLPINNYALLDDQQRGRRLSGENDKSIY